MAYASGSRRGGSSRRSSSRGGGRRGGARGASRGTSRGGRRGPPPRGGNSATPMVVAGVLVAVVIAVIILVSKDKPKPRPVEESTELTAHSTVDPTTAQPVERPKPYPEISEEIVLQAKEIVSWMEAERAEGEEHYKDAMAAKESGDEATWQAKLHEAREHFQNINERWNAEVVEPIMDELPPDCPYDADEVANHHVGREAGKVNKALERLASINKQLRSR